MARIGIDIGGTFTDLIASGCDGQVLATYKLASTPDDPARAAMQGAEQLLRKAGLDFGDVEFCCHGTTVATNALLERKGAGTGLVTTRGFRDVLHIGRKDRPYNFSHYQEIARQSRPLAPRRWRMTVRETIRAPNGEVEVPLNEEDVLEAVARLKEQDVEAVAVCCLFSFLNPKHEQRIAAIARRELPQAFVTASHEIAPLVREYERFSSTAMNAYVGPVTTRYIRRFATALEEAGVPAQLRLMTSSGGMVAPAEAERRPVNLLLSGPVGALIAGIEAAREIGRQNVITLDVGATSANVSCFVYSFESYKGRYQINVEINEGSYGGRHGRDGLDAVDTLMANTRNNPLEEMELSVPMLCERYELRDEAPAAGRWRGGMGAVKTWRFLEGAAVSSTGDNRSGDRLEITLVSGGGYGDLLERDPARVANDVLDGLYSVDEARDSYGVVIDPHSGTADLEATEKLRRKRAAGAE